MATNSVTSHSETQRDVRPSATRLRVFFLLLGSFCLIIVATAAVQYHQQRHWRTVLEQEITRNLTQKAQLIANRIDADHTHTVALITRQEGQAAGARVTVVDSAGRVAADSENPVASADAEGTRPEFVAALHGAPGTEIRTPNGAAILYVAVPMPGGAVRLAYPLSDIEVASAAAAKIFVADSAFALFLAILISVAAVRFLPNR